MKEVDVLVIGSGVAGLSYALHVAAMSPQSKVLVAAKASIMETNTNYAQGGIAAVLDLLTDSYQKHVQDTLEAGAWLCDPAVVETVVQEAPARIADLIGWGVGFDTTPAGSFHLGKEGGHSENRILHCKDQTGHSIEEALCQRVLETPNIEVLPHHFALDLITDKNTVTGATCQGALLLDIEAQKTVRVLAKVTLLATGGAGQVYQETTNPVIATGDGVAMAHRAGAQVAHMEFVQFHPTALYNPGEKPSFLVSEAVRGFGAVLRNKLRRAFVEEYDPRGSLAPRDIVARAIDAEMKKSGTSCVYLDVTRQDPQAFQDHFPTIYRKCLSLKIDPAKSMIPVVPAAHYFCGGIKADAFARTSVQHLYACGECASTGLHGANRLASNSLLEALVFARRAAVDTCETLAGMVPPAPQLVWFAKPIKEPGNAAQLERLRKEVQALMSSQAGIVRNQAQLRALSSRLRTLAAEVGVMMSLSALSVPLCELNNLLTVARLVVEAALSRKEPIGLHYLAQEHGLPSGEHLQEVGELQH